MSEIETVLRGGRMLVLSLPLPLPLSLSPSLSPSPSPSPTLLHSQVSRYTETFDRAGHACVYMRQHTKPDPTSDELCMKYMLWSFEMAMFKMLEHTKGRRWG